MHPTGPHYHVSIEARLPELEAERLFVLNEKEHVRQAMAKTRHRPKLLEWLLPVAGEPAHKDYQQYLRKLDHYLGQIDRHEDEIANGLVPVKFFVANTGGTEDKDIHIHIRVENGTVHPAKQPPERPEPVDSPEHTPEWQPTSGRPTLGGFERTDVEITAHGIKVRFSELEPEDSADVVHRLLYIQGNPDTRFWYEIQSKHLPEPLKGEINY